ncbi:methyltransferase, FxLD system [Cryptosporangium aurantiacum]|uniref:Protein-L-isoaspartate O-methyltransferase n=1 Tax=Cryptosporangium aurantiacum TaxID=134849 RepID=A0A1M7RA74_9ACTN|nr:methyltransferase, FxLD system [Cryptosporangium aurantiacum]SHN43245.1 protein-L-isoaspartate(D-aspartate) O-methyltransferase [Cryptosporangium aurantiacum]
MAPADEPGSDTRRRALVAAIDEWRAEVGAPIDARVRAAMLTVPREAFVPGLPLADVYDEQAALVTKRDTRGVPVSSVSAPSIVAMMLTQLDVRPGQRVLEIGSGGYNAALLREIVGPTGRVTTVDVDADVVARARRCLAAVGRTDVAVVHADGEFGVPDSAPYDRIVVTVEAADIPPAWVEQLVEGGRLVVPLRMCGLTRSVVFHRVGRTLVSSGYELCGFVRMRGAGERRERRVPLREDEVYLVLDDGQDADARALRSALGQARIEVPTGVVIGPKEPYVEHLDLWLATTLSGFCLLVPTEGAVERGLVNPAWGGGGAAALTRGGTFAYRSWRRRGDQAELGVTAHGPEAMALAAEFADAHRAWAQDRQLASPARITVYPAGTPDADLPAGYVLDRPHTRTVVSWP